MLTKDVDFPYYVLLSLLITSMELTGGEGLTVNCTSMNWKALRTSNFSSIICRLDRNIQEHETVVWSLVNCTVIGSCTHDGCRVTDDSDAAFKLSQTGKMMMLYNKGADSFQSIGISYIILIYDSYHQLAQFLIFNVNGASNLSCSSLQTIKTACVGDAHIAFSPNEFDCRREFETDREIIKDTNDTHLLSKGNNSASTSNWNSAHFPSPMLIVTVIIILSVFVVAPSIYALLARRSHSSRQNGASHPSNNSAHTYEAVRTHGATNVSTVTPTQSRPRSFRLRSAVQSVEGTSRENLLSSDMEDEVFDEPQENTTNMSDGNAMLPTRGVMASGGERQYCCREVSPTHRGIPASHQQPLETGRVVAINMDSGAILNRGEDPPPVDELVVYCVVSANGEVVQEGRRSSASPDELFSSKEYHTLSPSLTSENEPIY